MIKNREQMMDYISKHIQSVRPSEDFDGSENGIWVGAEDDDNTYCGSRIYDYYSEDHSNREFGVLNKWENQINKYGWYSEWQDVGTIIIWKLN